LERTFDAYRLLGRFGPDCAEACRVAEWPATAIQTEP
jgi:hypothetical protein